MYNLSQLVVTSIVLTCLSDVDLITKHMCKYNYVFLHFSVSIGQASQILTGHLVGANKMDEAYKQGSKGYRNALIITMIISVIGIIFRTQLISILPMMHRL